jgi:hypothetical protein
MWARNEEATTGPRSRLLEVSDAAMIPLSWRLTAFLVKP